VNAQYWIEQLRAMPIALAFIGIGVVLLFSVPLALGLISATLFLIAGVCFFHDLRLSRRGCRAQGTVVDFMLEEECYLPVVEFSDRSGVTRRMTTRTGRGIKQPACGNRVRIIYDPDGKSGCEIDTFFRRWGVTLMIAGLGVLFATGARFAE